MKHKLALLLWCIAVFTNVCDAEVIKHELSFYPDDFKTLEILDGCSTIIYTKGSSCYPESGHPCLPQIAVNIAIPGDLCFQSYNVDISKHLYSSNIRLTEGPIQYPTSMDSFDLPYAVEFQGSGIFPNNNCNLLDISKWTDIVVLHFLVCPFIYNSDTFNLDFIDKICITIETQRNLDNSTDNVTTLNYSPSYLKELISNKDTVRRNQSVIHSEIFPQTEYLIITRESLKDSFIPLCDWKRIKGIPSAVVTTEEIQMLYDSSDTLLNIKKYIHDKTYNSKLKYVLLGGDDTIIPVRSCINYNRRNENISDMFYSCADGTFNWDLNNNSIYGEVADSINLMPSLFLTRAPIRTKGDAQIFVKKVLEYEQHPQYNHTLLLGGCKLYVPTDSISPTDAFCQGQVLYSTSIQPCWTGQKFQLFDYCSDFGDGYGFTRENIREQLSKGYSFVDINTHGSPMAWVAEDDTKSYYYGYASNQTNCGHTIITTSACSTNAFDNSDIFGAYDPCLSESFIRNPESGIITYLGCSREGFTTRYNYDIELGASMQYTSEVYKELFNDSVTDKNFGKIVTIAKSKMINYCFNKIDYKYRHIMLGLNPIGDPEMPIWIDAPKKFDKFTIKYDRGMFDIASGESDCRTCVMSKVDKGDSYYKIFENEISTKLSNLPTLCNICITKQGFIPLVKTIRIIQNERISSKIEADMIIIGSNITQNKTYGTAVISDQDTDILSSSMIRIEAGTVIGKNTNLKTIKAE